MTLVGNRIEWVLTLLACWRMGAVALPCNTMLRRARPGAAGRGRRPGALRRRGGAAGGAARRGADDDDGRGRRRPRRGPAAGDAGRGRGDGPRGPGADRLHLRHHRRAARGRARLPLPVRPADPGRALVRLAQGRAGLVHDRDRLVEVGPQRLPRPLADRRRRGHPRRPLRPRRAARLRRGARRQRPLPGADRVPDAGQAHRACARCPRCAGWSPPASRWTRRRSPPSSAATGLEPADGYGQTETGQVTANLAGEPVRQGSMGKPLPGIEVRIAAADAEARRAASCSCAPPPPPPSSPATSTASASRASGGRPATWSAKTTTATSSSRAATTTSSSPPATGSAPSRSSRRCSPTPPSPRPPRSPPPTPSAAPSSAPSSSPATREPSEELARELQEHCKRADRPLQGPPHRRVRRRAAEDHQRQDQARRSCARGNLDAMADQTPTTDPASVGRAYFEAVGAPRPSRR